VTVQRRTMWYCCSNATKWWWFFLHYINSWLQFYFKWPRRCL